MNAMRRIACMCAVCLMLTGTVSAMPAGTMTAYAAETADIENEKAEIFRERVLAAWDSYDESEIEISDLKMTYEEFYTAYVSLIFSHPEYFYVVARYAHRADGGYVSAVKQRYGFSDSVQEYAFEDLPQMQVQLDAAVQEIVDGIQPEWDTARILLYFHDQLDLRIVYNEEIMDGSGHRTAYDALVNGDTVCQGYALGMKLLCDTVGIPCYCIGSAELNHSWNVVQVSGKWYHLDATWGDPVPDLLGQAQHSFLLRSDDYMRENGHDADDWMIRAWDVYAQGLEITCDSNAYDNAFWVTADDSITMLPDGTFIYMSTVDPADVQRESDVYAELRRFTPGTDWQKGFFEILCTLYDSWNGPAESKYLKKSKSFSAVYEDAVYFNSTIKIYRYSLTDNTYEVYYELTDEQKALGQIFGLTVDENGVLRYQVQQYSTSKDPTFYTLQLPVTAVTLGDINGDGKIDAADAQNTLTAYLETVIGNESGLTEAQFAAADIDGDGMVTAADAQMILIYYLNNDIAQNPLSWDDIRSGNL